MANGEIAGAAEAVASVSLSSSTTSEGSSGGRGSGGGDRGRGCGGASEVNSGGAEVEGGGRRIIAPPVVELIRCDFLANDSWKEADVVLVNSCCFSEALFASIEARAAALLKPGTLVVTLRQQFVGAVQAVTGDGKQGALPPPHRGVCWELIEATERRMSWGPSMMFVYRKTDWMDGPLPAPAPAPT